MKISIRTEYIELQSLLKLSGITGTGGSAKILISEGGVKVNGETCLARGKKIRPGDVVAFGGEEITVCPEAGGS